MANPEESLTRSPRTSLQCAEKVRQHALGRQLTVGLHSKEELRVKLLEGQGPYLAVTSTHSGGELQEGAAGEGQDERSRYRSRCEMNVGRVESLLLPYASLVLALSQAS